MDLADTMLRKLVTGMNHAPTDAPPDAPLPLRRVSLKEWMRSEAERLGITYRAFETRYYRGLTKKPTLVRKNQRLIYVLIPKGNNPHND